MIFVVPDLSVFLWVVE